ncbi:MAG: DNA-binding protein [Comamonadaceae bacterium]|nr:MAG: DNA-binding protein [Comamonadaceae bacterium]
MADLISAARVAEMLGVSARKVYELAQSGKLRCYRIDSCLRFSINDVETYRTSCLSVTTRETSVGALSSTRLLRASGSGLAAYFQKATPKPKRTSSTTRKRSASTRLQLVSANQSP